MNSFHATMTLAFALPLLASAAVSGAKEPVTADYAVGDRVPLTASDLEAITSQVLAENPLLSSSPGIKFASAQRSVRSADFTEVIFYPHAESAGIKYAFQVECWRDAESPSWDCREAAVRRYVQLDSQDFEVRVRGDISSDAALALIDATRRSLPADATDTVVPQTATVITPYKSGYVVIWGSPEGYGELTMQAYLEEGGDPANAADWKAGIFVPEE